jgi:hypothetical protein
MRVFLLAMLTIGLIGCSPTETRTETTTTSRSKSAAEPFNQPKSDGVRVNRPAAPMAPPMEQKQAPEPAQSVAVDQELAALVAKYNVALDKYVRFYRQLLVKSWKRAWEMGDPKKTSHELELMLDSVNLTRITMERGDLKLMESEIKHHPRFSDYNPSEEIILKIKPTEIGAPWGQQEPIEFRYYDLK